MVKMKKWALAVLVILAAVCGGVGSLALQDAGVLSRLGIASGSGSQSGDYRHYLDTYGKVEELRRYIKDYYYTDVKDEDLQNGMLKGLFEGLGDPYSQYLDASEYDDYMNALTGEYTGIGVTLAAGESGYVEVIAPKKGSPADEAGIKTGDLVIAVDGVEYTGAELDVCAAKIRGDEGTQVTLTIRREDRVFDVTITRTTIITETVESRMMDGNVAYISVSSFEDNTAADFGKALADMESSGAVSLVIDLRNNPGGLVDSCVEIADMLMEKGIVAYTEDHDGQKDYFRTAAGRTALPYAVLVNEGSASASEILCAGIQDNSEGILVGTVTYGKGVIQSIIPLSDGSGFKLTTLQYFSPSGKVINKVGITPGYIVELTEDCYDEKGNLVDDLQLKKALELLGN